MACITKPVAVLQPPLTRIGHRDDDETNAIIHDGTQQQVVDRRVAHPKNANRRDPRYTDIRRRRDAPSFRKGSKVLFIIPEDVKTHRMTK